MTDRTKAAARDAPPTTAIRLDIRRSPSGCSRWSVGPRPYGPGLHAPRRPETNRWPSTVGIRSQAEKQSLFAGSGPRRDRMAGHYGAVRPGPRRRETGSGAFDDEGATAR